MAEIAVLSGETWTCELCEWVSGPLGRMLPQSPIVVEDIREHARQHGKTMSEVGHFTGKRMMTLPVIHTTLRLEAGRG